MEYNKFIWARWMDRNLQGIATVLKDQKKKNGILREYIRKANDCREDELEEEMTWYLEE